MEAAESDYELDFSDPRYGEAARVIQRQAKVMIARNNFRVALYKLILIKNIVETKMHKELVVDKKVGGGRWERPKCW